MLRDVKYLFQGGFAFLILSDSFIRCVAVSFIGVRGRLSIGKRPSPPGIFSKPYYPHDRRFLSDCF